MKHAYQLVFQDKFGIENTICYSDGRDLQMNIRGIDFSASSFNMMSFENINKKHQSKFEINKCGDLMGVFIVDIPLYIQRDIDILDQAILKLTFDYTKGNEIHFVLIYDRIILSSDNRIFDDVEGVLMTIQKQLPKNCKLKCCMACRYSSYHPVGNNDFGSLSCFYKVNKDELNQVIDKRDLMLLWEKAHENNLLENVQETFLCNCFEEQTQETCLYKSF